MFHAPAARSVARTGRRRRCATCRGGALTGVSMDIRRGEILGLAGLIGSGFDDLPYLVYGARAADGRDAADCPRSVNAPLRDMSPACSRSPPGIVLLPRTASARPASGSCRSPTTSRCRCCRSSVRCCSTGRRSSARALALGPGLRGAAERSGDDPRVACRAAISRRCCSPSGCRPNRRLLMLDEPTQGVDVGARQHVFAALAAAAARGVAIVVASTDYGQLEQICDRVLIFARGAVVAELTGDRDQQGQHRRTVPARRRGRGFGSGRSRWRKVSARHERKCGTWMHQQARTPALAQVQLGALPRSLCAAGGFAAARREYSVRSGRRRSCPGRTSRPCSARRRCWSC